MTESSLPPAWFNDLFNGVTICIFQLDPDFEEADRVISTPGQGFSHFVDLYDFNKQSLESITSALGPNVALLALAKRDVPISRPKQSLKKVKPQRASGILTDKARKVRACFVQQQHSCNI